jgi:hypothetical protein
MLCSPASVSLRRRVKPGARRVVVRRSQNMNAIMILNDAPGAEIISDALASAVSGRDSFQRQAIADTLVDDATQLLRQRHAGIAGSERRKLRDPSGDRARPIQQALTHDDFADHAERFRLLGIEHLLSEHECAAPDRADDLRPE